MSEEVVFTVPASPFRAIGYLYPVWNFSMQRAIRDVDSEADIHWEFLAGARLDEIGDQSLKGVASVRLSANLPTNSGGNGSPLFTLDVEALGTFEMVTEHAPTLEDLENFSKLIRVNGLTYLVSALRPEVRDFLLKAATLEALIPGLNVGALDETAVFSAFQETWNRLKADSSKSK